MAMYYFITSVFIISIQFGLFHHLFVCGWIGSVLVVDLFVCWFIDLLVVFHCFFVVLFFKRLFRFFVCGVFFFGSHSQKKTKKIQSTTKYINQETNQQTYTHTHVYTKKALRAIFRLRVWKN